MSVQTQYSTVTPRLGTYYAIFASALAAMVVLLLILEQLGARKLWLSHIMIVVPLLCYVIIAATARTIDVHEFYACGRRVPPVYGGLALAATSIGGVGFLALTGALYLIGFDALCFGLGIGAGFVVAAVAIMPYLRKAGAYTLAGFFRERLANPLVGPVASLLVLPPAVILLAAELQLGAFVASLFASVTIEMAIQIGAALIIAMAIFGGVRSLTWTQCAQYIVVIAGFLVPLIIAAIAITTLPLPQLTYGELFERIATHELAIGALRNAPEALAEGLPGIGLEPAVKPFLLAFGAIGAGDFALLTLCFLAGTAVMPGLMMRAGTASDVFEMRRTMGWGTLFIVLFLISAPAFAAFAKFITLHDLVGTPASQLPDWVTRLQEGGLADLRDKNGDGVIGATEVLVLRDTITLALPIMNDLPFILVVLVASAAIAATLAATSAHVVAVANTISEDLYHGVLHRSATPGRRLIVARLCVVALTVLAAWFVTTTEFDVLRAAAWAMSLAASAFLPSLVLAIWWKRTTGWGVLAGMLVGFGLAASYIYLAETGQLLFGLSSLLAAVIGVPAGAAAAVAVSYLTPAPAEDIADIVEELRDPSGEALHDRIVRTRQMAEEPSEAAP